MKRSLIVIAAIVTLALPAICSAASQRPGGYATGFLGVSVPRDADVTSFDGIDTFSDRVEFDPGIYLGGTAGYDFGMVRLEGELSYRHSEIKSITDQVDGFQFRNPSGDLGALAMMFNGFFDLHTDTPVTPYWGGGIGFAVLYLSDTSGTDTRGGVTDRPLLYPKDDDTVFAYQAGAGVEIALNRNISLDVGYRYFGTSKARFDSDLITTTELKFQSHNGMVGVRVKF